VRPGILLKIPQDGVQSAWERAPRIWQPVSSYGQSGKTRRGLLVNKHRISSMLVTLAAEALRKTLLFWRESSVFQYRT
jgi:hypothetical protein